MHPIHGKERFRKIGSVEAHPIFAALSRRRLNQCKLASIHVSQEAGSIERQCLNPFSASSSELLLFEGFERHYWSNPPFLIFDIRALWRSVLSARAPECQKLKTVG